MYLMTFYTRTIGGGEFLEAWGAGSSRDGITVEYFDAPANNPAFMHVTLNGRGTALAFNLLMLLAKHLPYLTSFLFWLGDM